MIRLYKRERTRNPRCSRRELLRAGALSIGSIGLGDLLKGASAVQSSAPARSVILLWLWGGPSHLDSFDMKPGAPVEYRGPFAPVPTAVPGLDICELFPRLARRSKHYSVIRSLHHTSNDHGIAGTIGLTGSDAGAASLSGQVLPGTLLPAHGACVTRALGMSAGMPRFVTMGGMLHQGKRRIAGEGGGSLGARFDPFRLDYDPERGVKIPQLDLIEGQSVGSLTARRSLRAQLNQLARIADESSPFEQLDESYQQAYSLLTSKQAREAFELAREPEPLRRRYGQFRFGQCCLLARRLVEAGVRFVQVNWSSDVEPIEDRGDGGWDMHDRNFQQMQDRHGWMLDQSLSTLLDDLQQRGLLDETLVVAVGEFGRTPKINAKAGRDHWHQCYSGLVAGGGLRMGEVVGASDALGEYPVNRLLAPADLFRTVFHQMGISTATLTEAGLPLQGEVIEDLVG